MAFNFFHIRKFLYFLEFGIAPTISNTQLLQNNIFHSYDNFLPTRII